jgi:hypothetical protein
MHLQKGVQNGSHVAKEIRCLSNSIAIYKETPTTLSPLTSTKLFPCSLYIVTNKSPNDYSFEM